ncbi:MAG TPA: amino acid adenylation domain-containing protein [Pyrinomonadaceae bacterium]|jgi:amino acid adenylation domain-containing protein|nr:amino acid adenylation domain-containing protein [Pyrinomonadaceae bacterium]
MSTPQIEAIYPLSPLQEGMLFHTLHAPDNRSYFVQMSCLVRGELNVAAFRQAWRRVVERHAVLRTFFTWERRERPLQVVLPQVSLPWEQHDWRHLPAAEQERRLAELLREDRERGFDLAQAPLLRLTLARTSDDSHRFVWSFHHILLDGWSMPLLMKEVLQLYAAACGGREAELESPRPFRDYMAWLGRQEAGRAEPFWRETLKGFTAPTPLGVDHPAAPDAPGGYSEFSARLSDTVTASLAALAKRHGLTLNVVVQGAWALLLSRYAGSDDVLFGATSSGRPVELAGVETMVGLFINTLPVRARLRRDEPLLPWLGRLQSQQLEARQHEFAPLVQVQGWSEVPRGVPLFESLFIFENYPVADTLREHTCGLRFEDVRVSERTNYPLVAVAAPGPELLLKVGYDHRRFDADSAARILDHFRNLLEAIAARPEQRLGDLPLLDEAERRLITEAWNDTARDYAADSCVHELFEAQAERTPDSVALNFGGRELTYRELNERANQLAHHLRALGVGPEARVAVCVERSTEMVVAALGVLKAGGAYLPLDPSYPKERLAFMLEDSGARVLLTQSQLLAGLPPHGARALCLDSDWEAVAGAATSNPAGATTPRNLAYVIYTSGSTGRPKGVMVEHRGVNNLAAAQIRAFDVRPESRVLQFASFSFDASVSEFFTALLCGATLCLETQSALLPGPELLELLRDRGITTVTFPPSALAAMPAAPLPTLRTVVTAGEACPADLVSRWGEGRRFINAYGPTEATVCATIGECDGDGSKPTIGRPMENVRVYLLDESMSPVPVGVPGELYVGGAGLARGYLNRPALTAERFIPDPFSAEPGARLYRTGDLARHLPDGRIDFLGRGDNQVKIRGFRIELGEVEAVLGRHPEVRDAAVLAREDAPGEKRLVAYVVARNGQEPTPAALRDFLRAALPEYMVPPAFVVLDAMPLTPNGKVDRKALPAPDRAKSGARAAFVEPRTEIERAVTAAWQQVLKVEQVGLSDNFFDLGGHSLLMIQVQSRLREALGRSIAITDLFKYPTVSALASHLSEEAGPAPAAVLGDAQAEKLREGRSRLRERARQRNTRAGLA